MTYKSYLLILFSFISLFAFSDISTISILTKDGKTINAKKIVINEDVFTIQILDNSEIKIPISSVISIIPNNNSPNNNNIDSTKSNFRNQTILQQNPSQNINNEYKIGERIQLGTIEFMIMNIKWESDKNINPKRNSRIKNTTPIKQNDLLLTEAKMDNIFIQIFLKNIGNNPIDIDNHKPNFQLINDMGGIFIESKTEPTKKIPQEPLNPSLYTTFTIKFHVVQHHQYKLKATYKKNIIIIDLKK
ncbi:MAG: hypothetical protein NT106_11525 [Candidatus Sumerlaeota bacterium]|nr:hypothetical protein [Candidatus Sumerlaeota bacterium]